MVEFGLKESACSCPHRQLSSTLRSARANSVEEEDFLEVHYADDPDKKGQGSLNHTAKLVTKEGKASVTSEESSQTLSPASSKGTADGGRTPTGGIREKSDIEGLEKNKGETTIVIKNEGLVGDSVDIEKITRPVEIQRSNAENVNCGDQVILEESSRTTAKVDPLEFMEDITQVQHVQETSTTRGVGESGGKKEGNDTERTQLTNEHSEENLALSEGTASEFGTTSNMEELLEAEEEGLEWGEDRLLLEIESEMQSESESKW